MSEIHYFPRYSQKENFVTNNTLLLLLRLHQYSRFKFQTFMEKLCVDQQDMQLSTSWLHFQQQKGTGKSVVDGFISQDSVKIAVETKLADSFDLTQLEKHLSVFHDEQHMLLVMLSPTPDAIPHSTMEFIRALPSGKKIQVLHTTFEDIVRIAGNCLSDHDEEMRALVNDYESFCSEMGILPRDKHLIFVPPCGKSLEDNFKFRLYYCPATSTRRKTKYIGIYATKVVRAIGRINKVVTCDVIDFDKVTTQNGDPGLMPEEEKRIIAASLNAHDEHGWDLAGHKFYLCDEWEETDYRKMSAGGMAGHRYFDVKEILDGLAPNTTAELASLLRQHTWS